MKFVKKTISTLAICSLMLNSHVAFAEEAQSSTPSTSTGVFDIGKTIVTAPMKIATYGADAAANAAENLKQGKVGDTKVMSRAVARPISGYLLKRMGTPGYLLTKYMSYRQQVTQPRCTLSEQMSFGSYVLMLLGDIGNHVLVFKNNKDMEKDFKSKHGQIEAQMKSSEFMNNIKNGTISNTEAKPQEVDIQLTTLDFMIQREEKDLKREELVAKFKYPALALNLGATALNYYEIMTETASFGALGAKVAACKTAQKPQVEIKQQMQDLKDQAARQAESHAKRIQKVKGDIDKANADAPWYVKPFTWLASKLGNNAEKIDRFAGKVDKYSNGVNGSAKTQLEYAEAAQAQGANLVDAVSPSQSAAYAEEMIVGIVAQFKKPSKEDGIKGKVINEGTDMAIRYGVRKLIKANIAAIDKFLHSGIGRTVVFGYNLWIIYTEFDNTKKEIEGSKNRIAVLKEYREKFIEATANPVVKLKRRLERKIDDSKEVMAWVGSLLVDPAYAAIEKNNLSDVNLRICISDSQCKERFDLLQDPQFKETFAELPKSLQQVQINEIKNSYTTKQFVALTRGQLSVTEFDLVEVEKEIKQKSAQVDGQYQNLFNQKKLNPEQLNKFEQKFIEDQLTELEQYMRPGYQNEPSHVLASVFGVPDLKLQLPGLPEQNQKSPLSNVAGLNAPIENPLDLPNSERNVASVATSEVKDFQNMKYKFNTSEIHQADKNLFEIIHQRYLQSYDRLIWSE